MSLTGKISEPSRLERFIKDFPNAKNKYLFYFIAFLLASELTLNIVYISRDDRQQNILSVFSIIFYVFLFICLLTLLKLPLQKKVSRSSQNLIYAIIAIIAVSALILENLNYRQYHIEGSDRRKDVSHLRITLLSLIFLIFPIHLNARLFILITGPVSIGIINLVDSVEIKESVPASFLHGFYFSFLLLIVEFKLMKEKPFQKKMSALEAKPLDSNIMRENLYLRSILNSIPDSIVLLNKSSKPIFLNSTFEMMLNEEGGEVDSLFKKVKITATGVAKSYSMETGFSLLTKPESSLELQSPAPQRSLYDVVRSSFYQSVARKMNGPMNYEAFFTKADDSKMHLTVTLKFQPDQKEDLLLISLKQPVRTLEKKTSLEPSNMSTGNKRDLIGTTAHEMRTPLNGCLNFIDLALRSSESPDALKNNYLLPAYNAGSILLNLLNDLVDYSQLSANKLRLVFQQTDIRQLCQQCIGLLKYQAIKKKIILRSDIEPDVPQVINTDPNRLTQVILNLLNNAIKFTFEGSVLLSVVSESHNLIRIFVEDTGIGIKEEDRALLFNRFGKVRLGEKSILNPMGAGLGLAISFTLSEHLGPENGKGIEVESEYGKGSQFSFLVANKSHSLRAVESLGFTQQKITFTGTVRSMTQKVLPPTILEEESQSNPTQNCIEMRTKELIEVNLQEVKDYRNELNNKYLCVNSKRSIDLPDFLIVDDEPLNVMIIENFLVKAGNSVRTCYSGKEALRLIDERAQNTGCPFFKAVITDLYMPLVDGYKVAEEVQRLIRNGRAPDTKIILLTGDLDADFPEDWVSIQTLFKPVNRQRLFDAIQVGYSKTDNSMNL